MENLKPKIPPYRPVRCVCGRRLGDFQLMPGSGYRIRCPKCGAMNATKTIFNTTSVLVFMSLLRHANGQTPTEAVHYLVEFAKSEIA